MGPPCKLPLGCNVESVAIRREEIEASLQLVRDVRALFEAPRANY